MLRSPWLGYISEDLSKAESGRESGASSCGDTCCLQLEVCDLSGYLWSRPRSLSRPLWESDRLATPLESAGARHGAVSPHPPCPTSCPGSKDSCNAVGTFQHATRSTAPYLPGYRVGPRSEYTLKCSGGWIPIRAGVLYLAVEVGYSFPDRS